MAAVALPPGARGQDVGDGEGAASASDEGRVPAEAPAGRVAVMMLPTDGAASAIADALTELLVGAVVARGEGLLPIGKEEFQAQLGQGDAASAACLESPACLGRIAVQLGVVEVIAGTLARHDGPSGGPSWAFHLLRLDVRRGEARGQVFREVEGGVEALLDAIEEAFPELYARRVAPGRLVLRAGVLGARMLLDGVELGRFEGAPLRRETVEPGVHQLEVRAAGHVRYRREIVVEEGATLMLDALLEPSAGPAISPLVYTAGAAALAMFAGAAVLGAASQASPSGALSMRETVEGFYPAREAEALGANLLVGGGVLGVVLGLSGWLVPMLVPDPEGTAR